MEIRIGGVILNYPTASCPKILGKAATSPLRDNALIPFKTFDNLQWIVFSRLNRFTICYFYGGRTY